MDLQTNTRAWRIIIEGNRCSTNVPFVGLDDFPQRVAEIAHLAAPFRVTTTRDMDLIGRTPVSDEDLETRFRDLVEHVRAMTAELGTEDLSPNETSASERGLDSVHDEQPDDVPTVCPSIMY